MKILTLNIRHGGGQRLPAIADYLSRLDADLVVITEYRAGKPGDALSLALRELGYCSQWPSIDEPRKNGVLLATRLPAEGIDLGASPDNQRRIVGCRIDSLVVFGVYFALGAGKASLFDFIEDGSPSWIQEPGLLIGDFNTGLHRVDEQGATFHLSDRFERLQSHHGWTDAWRMFHGNEQDFTWLSPRGNGFRLDHAFASPSALPSIVSVDYDHSTRPGITDHSAMTLVYRT